MRFEIFQGSCVDVLAKIKAAGIVVDHVITDPPYSRHVHKAARGIEKGEIVARDFGYSYLSPAERHALLSFCASNVRRWSIMFSDVESAYMLRLGGVAAGLDYVRTRAWQRWSAPQFTGDRPSTDHESVVFLHKKGFKAWNKGGGGTETFMSEREDLTFIFEEIAEGKLTPAEAVDRFFLTHKCLRKKEKAREGHPNEKPISLMRQLVGMVIKPGEVVLDPFCGSATTGQAVLEAGGIFLGIEENPEWVTKGTARLERAVLPSSPATADANT